MKKYDIFFKFSGVLVVFACIVCCTASILLAVGKTMEIPNFLTIVALIFAAVCLVGLFLMLLIRTCIRREQKKNKKELGEKQK